MSDDAAESARQHYAELVAALEGEENLSREQRGALLKALHQLRELQLILRQERMEQIASGVHRVIVEGFSGESAERAFAAALDKAAHYFDEHHDVAITVLGVIDLPKGGHRATLELHITQMTLRDYAHRESADLERKHINERDDKLRTKRAEHKAEHMVYDHFLRTAGTTPHVPDHLLINIKDADILNMMIEREFFRAGHGQTGPSMDYDVIPRMMVRLNRPAPGGDEDDRA